MAKRTTATQRANRHSHIEQFEAELAELDKAEHTGWLAEGLQDATDYKLSPRQEVALQKVYSAGRWICDGVLEDEPLALICDEFRVFLSAAGLGGPHYKPPADAHWFLQDTYEAYVSAKAWRRNRAAGKAREASLAAYHVGLFTAAVFFEACQPGTERDWNYKLYRSRGGKARAAGYAKNRALYQKEVDRLVQEGLTYSSALENVRNRFKVSKRHVEMYTKNPRKC